MIHSGNIYSWCCSGGVPEIVSQANEIDARGFVALTGKPLADP